MKCDEYLRQGEVQQFIEWLRPRVRGGAPFPHSYRTRKPAGDWCCGSIQEASEKYRWRGEGFGANQEQLDRLAKDLQQAMECGDTQRFVKAVVETLKWGNVAHRATVAKLRELGDEAPAAFCCASRLLDPSRADTSRLDGVRYMNSGWTKVYSLLRDDFPMYDGRVGAALGYLVRLHCAEQRLERVPPPLRFRWLRGRSAHNRNPSCGTLKFPRLNHGVPRTWAECNVRAAWVLGAVRDEARFGGLDPCRRLRALEAALFMIGYELPV